MKIKCMLTDSNEYNSFCGLENSIYTVKISKKHQYWYYDLCDMIYFYDNSDVELVLDISDCDISLAKYLYGNHKFNENILRENESEVMVHTTTLESSNEILADGAIKCWNLLKKDKNQFENTPIGSLLGDIADFSNYVMLSPVDVNNEIIVASKQQGCIDTNPNQTYEAGARFYLDAKKLASDGLLLRDGQHIKVREEISLDKYLVWYSTAKKIGVPSKTTPLEFFEQSNRAFKKYHKVNLIDITKENIAKYKSFEEQDLTDLSQYLSRVYPDYNKVVKWCYINVDNENIGSIWLEKMDTNIVKLGVFIADEQYRNKGYGTDAIRKMLTFAKDVGYQNVILNVRVSNARAFSVYKKLGFSEVKRYTKNNGVEVITMKHTF